MFFLTAQTLQNATKPDVLSKIAPFLSKMSSYPVLEIKKKSKRWKKSFFFFLSARFSIGLS